MGFVLGFLGAIFAMGLFVGGSLLGWHLCGEYRDHTQQVTAEQLTEAQKRRVAEEQEAWMALHNYSAETAYGVPAPSPTTAKE